MENQSITDTSAVVWHDYLALCKLKVVSLIVFTAIVGMFLATPTMVPWDVLIYGTIGIGLAACSAAAINHVVDHRIDSIMARTLRRPLPRGKVSILNAIIFSWFLGTISMGILAFLINPLTAGLTALSLIGYGFIYSMFLKRATPQNIVIGGAAGAAPPVLGWTAVTGTLDPNALLLFLIIFAWTPPHFWSLAIYRRDDYATVNVPMLPVTHGLECCQLAQVICDIRGQNLVAGDHTNHESHHSADQKDDADGRARCARRRRGKPDRRPCGSCPGPAARAG